MGVRRIFYLKAISALRHRLLIPTLLESQMEENARA